MKISILLLSIFGIALFYSNIPHNEIDSTELITSAVDPVEFQDTLSNSDESPPSLFMICEPSPQIQKEPDIITAFCSHLQLGANYTRVRISPKGSPSFSGNLGGLAALYEFRTSDRIYGGLKLAWRQGAPTGTAGKRSLIDGDIQERIGYTFGDFAQKNLFSLFSGFGFRYLRENHQPVSGASVKFKYQEYYMPVGFLYDHKFNSTFNLGLYFTWMPQVYPTVKIVPLRGARWILTNTLANFLIEAPFTFTSKSQRLSLIFKPFFEYWQDGHSTAETQNGLPLGLPGNTYLFEGINVSLCYSF